MKKKHHSFPTGRVKIFEEKKQQQQQGSTRHCIFISYLKFLSQVKKKSEFVFVFFIQKQTLYF